MMRTRKSERNKLMVIKKGVRENAFLIYYGYKEQRVFLCLKTVQAGNMVASCRCGLSRFYQ